MQVTKKRIKRFNIENLTRKEARVLRAALVRVRGSGYPVEIAKDISAKLKAAGVPLNNKIVRSGFAHLSENNG